MAKLSLMFEKKLMKEVPIGDRPVTIGRSPDNDLPVDNLAVSNYHARVYFEGSRLVVEDLDSLNGTFVNDLRVERATLHDGDSIWIGKHHIKVDATADTGERSQFSPSRVKMPTLIVLNGRVDQKEYVLTNKLTVIGKSSMATVQLRGWFKPQVAAQISQRDDGYYLGPGDKIPVVNGSPIPGPVKLNDGDLIEICGVRMNFVIRE